MDLSLDYAYKHIGSKAGDGARSDSHTVIPGLYLEHDANYSLTLTVPYKHSDGDNNTPSSFHSDSYGPSLNLDAEVLHFLGVDTDWTSLTVEADLAYTRTDGDSHTAGIKKGSSSDAYDIGPTLIFVQRLFQATGKDGTPFSRLALTMVPSYTFEILHSQEDGSTSQTAHTGLFSLLAQLDYGLTEKIFFSVAGTWDHDVNQSLPSGQMPSYHHWAQFSGGIVYRPNSTWRVKIAYSYEAFHPDYDSHGVSAHAELHF
jgi:hypothetical protein